MGHFVGVTLFTKFVLQGNYLTVGFATMLSKHNNSEPPQTSLAERRGLGYQTPPRMKQKTGCLVLCLLAVIFSGCVRPQTGIPENREPAVAETLPQKPPPINERLDGTVWVATSDMFEDIPIGGMTVYTFEKNELTFTDYNLGDDYTYSESHQSILYIILNDQTIEYFHDNSRYTVRFDGDDL
ncbi:MAG: hypothetical protein LBP29_08345, partial [Treponema sp.]|nr:hypothetical protein [Treponema sp.]